MSTLVGFYIGLHDSNIAVSLDGRVSYAKSERMTGVKHHRATMEFVRDMCDAWKVGPVSAVAFSDGNRNGLGICDRGQLSRDVAPLDGFPHVPTFCLDHHYCHVLSAWPLIDVARVSHGIAIDGRGDHGIRRCVIADPGTTSPALTYADGYPSMGAFLELIGKHMGLGDARSLQVDLAGKVMGAQAYGHIDEDYVASVPVDDIGRELLSLISKIPWRGQIPAEIPQFFDFHNPSFRDWLSSVHRILELETVSFFQHHRSPTGQTIYTGGCAQNVVCNESLIRDRADLVIPPHCYDGGLSLGAIEFLRLLRDEPAFSPSGFPYWQDDNEADVPTTDTIAMAAELLARGQIVGWFQGRGEIGPRALGNRSILMSPILPDGKDVLNVRVKHRECWRPYGASVLSAHAAEWFDIQTESPYMLRSVDVLPSKQAIVPAITHVDGTCRIQTVGDENPAFAELLDAFYKLTGMPMLLNTSLNGAGQPIFGSRQQCLEFMQTVDMDAVFMGNSAHTKNETRTGSGGAQRPALVLDLVGTPSTSYGTPS